MIETPKPLGQKATASATEWDLYTTPSGVTAVVSVLYVCNRGTSQMTVRISHAPAGAVTANEHYLVYDAPVDPNTAVPCCQGVILSETDVLRVYASTANATFNLYGLERS